MTVAITADNDAVIAVIATVIAQVARRNPAVGTGMRGEAPAVGPAGFDIDVLARIERIDHAVRGAWTRPHINRRCRLVGDGCACKTEAGHGCEGGCDNLLLHVFCTFLVNATRLPRTLTGPRGCITIPGAEGYRP